MPVYILEQMQHSMGLQGNINVTWSRGISHLSEISIPIFLRHFLIVQNAPLWCKPHYNWISGCITMSYEGFDNVKNNIKQRNLNSVFANISKTISQTSDSFLLIMSQIYLHCHMHGVPCMHAPVHVF